MAFDPKLQRQIMGCFATGVTVVTTRYGDHITGMTANAIMSLSLKPPRIVVSVDKLSHMHESLLQGKCFAINVLRADQESTSRQFAMPGPKDFSGLPLTVAETGAPVLVEALAFVDCRLVEILSGGDHDMFLGEPVVGEARDGEPLIFYGGGYTQLALSNGQEGIP
ncbi:MAG: flavin reductase family protein [Candidatus Poribacteria bacterium]|nr:flavin reductase family protein [Candidatus Poribacteria bacterium]